ncbi:proton-conducting transporter membrane subunit [Aeromicrobium sp. UC242_57]|uniref:NADH-quinone oxidoreductase subunit 5 family protein n=1 Tax=Aeromicrobium sp. UC242_57 TaxID=3374624 RepID=UPI0037A2DD5A
MTSFHELKGRWSYVALTAVLAVAAAIWAIPTAFKSEISFGWIAFEGQSGPDAGAPFPSLSPDLTLLPFSAQIVLLAVGVGLLVQIYSTAYLGHHPRYRSYALIIIVFLVAMIAVVGTSNLWVLLVGWEVMGLCSYLLIGHEWETGEARAGAAKAFLITRIADLGLLLAILVIGQTYGTYDIIGAQVVMLDDPQSSTLIGLLILVAVVGKSAQFPLHTWLPDAMPGPTPITALIHAATMVAAGVYLAARLFQFYADSAVVMTAMAVIAAVTMLLGALFALVQTDLKRALAWSTVSQLAFMFAAIAASDPGSGLDHLISHGVFKALLFLGCGCLMHAVGSSALSAMGGLRGSMPVTFWSMTVGFAALAGVVPTVGFFTKDSVLHGIHAATDGETALATGTAWALLVVALLTSFVTAAYATRLWLKAFFGPARDDQAAHEAPYAMSGPRRAAGGGDVRPLDRTALPPRHRTAQHRDRPRRCGHRAGAVAAGCTARLVDPATGRRARPRPSVHPLDPTQCRRRGTARGRARPRCRRGVPALVGRGGWPRLAGARARPVTQRAAVRHDHRGRRDRAGRSRGDLVMIVAALVVPFVVGVLVIALRATLSGRVAASIGAAAMAVSLALYALVWDGRAGSTGTGVSGEVDTTWIEPFGVHFHLGVTALSWPFLLMTAAIGLLCCLWLVADDTAPTLVGLVLVISAASLGVFSRSTCWCSSCSSSRADPDVVRDHLPFDELRGQGRLRGR